MGLLNRLFGTEPEYEEENPFVVNEPWEWPDDEEYDFDSNEDEDVEYAFQWADVPDDHNIEIMRRTKAGDYTYLVIVTYPSDCDENFCGEAKGIQILFDGTEQIHGQTRHYEYNENEDEPSTIEAEIDCYANTFDMPTTLSDDLYKSIYMIEYLGESMRQWREE